MVGEREPGQIEVCADVAGVNLPRLQKSGTRRRKILLRHIDGGCEQFADRTVRLAFDQVVGDGQSLIVFLRLHQRDEQLQLRLHHVRVGLHHLFEIADGGLGVARCDLRGGKFGAQ